MSLSNYNANRLVRLYDRRWTDLSNWRDLWQQISDFVMPQQDSFNVSWSMGQRRSDPQVFDSTALEANERLATRMHEALTSPATQWFHLSFQNDALNTDDTAREWLDECTRRLRSAIRLSNFDMIMGQAYLDLGALGTAMVGADEFVPHYRGPDDDTKFHGFTFRNYFLGNVGVAEDANGLVDEVFCKFDMTAEQWVQKFAERAPSRAHQAMDEGEPDKIIIALVCRFRRALKEKPTGPLPPQDRPWAEVWIDYSSKELVDDNGTYEQAVYTTRWRKKSQDIMGYGPGERALPTITTLNTAERLELAAWAKAIDPPIKTTANNIMGDLQMKAKGLTVVRKMDEIGQWDIRPDLQHHMIQTEDKRYQIREIFRYHSLELPPREQVGEMTAYEVSKRVEQVYRALGPTVVQTQADLLNPMLQRLFGIMYRKNALPPLPEALRDEQVQINYVGAMALAQRAVELESIDRFVADALALAQSGQPQATDIVDFDKTQRYKAEVMGVPAVVTRSVAEVAEIRRIREAQVQAAQAQQQALQASQTMKNMGQAVGQETMANAVDSITQNAVRQ
jgi:hypothetical protein